MLLLRVVNYRDVFIKDICVQRQLGNVVSPSFILLIIETRVVSHLYSVSFSEQGLPDVVDVSDMGWEPRNFWRPTDCEMLRHSADFRDRLANILLFHCSFEIHVKIVRFAYEK